MRAFFKFLEFLMINSGREYRDKFTETKIELLEGKKVRLMTFEDEVRERTIAEVTEKITAEITAKIAAEVEKAHSATARSLIEFGVLTDEQIAQAVQQTPEYVMSLRQELKGGNTH